MIYYLNLHTYRLEFDENFKMKKYEILKVIGKHVFIVSAVLLVYINALLSIPEQQDAFIMPVNVTLEEMKEVVNTLLIAFITISIMIAIVFKLAYWNIKPRIKGPRIITILVILLGTVMLLALNPFLDVGSRAFIGTLIVGPFVYGFFRDLLKMVMYHLNGWEVDEHDIERVYFTRLEAR